MKLLFQKARIQIRVFASQMFDLCISIRLTVKHLAPIFVKVSINLKEGEKMDQRVIKTKAALTQALFKLLENKTIEKITVTELCRTAHIDRRTFYIHYSNVSDIFEDYQDQMSFEVYQALSNAKYGAEGLLDVFHQILMQNYRGFKYLCLNQQQHLLVEKLQKMVFETLCDSLLSERVAEDNKVILKYLSSGLIDTYVYWFSHSDEVDYETLVKTNKKIVQANLELLH